MKIKILVSYHKPAKLIKDDVWTPIKVGNALNWDPDNLIEDNVGENISHLNASYNELTAIYWAWKNYDKLGNPDFIGFCHYRRVLVFSEMIASSHTIDINYDKQESLFEAIKYKKSWLEKLLLNNDCISWCVVDKKYSVKEQYKKSSREGEHVYQDLLDVEKIIEKDFPQYRIAAKNYLNGNSHYFGNVFVLRKDLFFEYCEFIFKAIKIFLSLHDDFDKRSPWLQRLFISERLTGIFITRLKETEYRVLDLPAGFLVNTDLPLPIERKYQSQDSINLVFSVDESHLSHLGVCLSAVAEKINSDRCYDVIILFSGIDKRKIDDFLTRVNVLCGNNFSVRFYDVSPWLENCPLKEEFLKKSDGICFQFFIQKIFVKYEKVLYLDYDLIVLRDLSEIYDLCSVGLEYIAAALDIRGSFAYQQNLKMEDGSFWRDYVNTDLAINDDRTYFQSGVMVYFLKEMRRDGFDLLESCLEKVKKTQKYVYLEQDVLNYVLKGRVKYLSSDWNFEWHIPLEFPSYKRTMNETLLKEYMEGQRSPKIIHYTSDRKPWNEFGHSLASIWWKCARTSLFYDDFRKNALSGLPVRDVNDIFRVWVRKILTYWKCKVFIAVGFSRKRYKAELDKLK